MSPQTKILVIIVVLLLGLGSFGVSAQDTAEAEVVLRINQQNTEDGSIQANNDYMSTDANESVTIGVLDNDRALDSTIDPASLEVYSDPASGTAEIVENQIRYTPNQDFSGSDSFRYQICNDQNDCDQATVFVEVQDSEPIPDPNPTPNPNPQPQDPVIINLPLPITGGQAVAAVGIISSLGLGAAGLILIRNKSKKAPKK